MATKLTPELWSRVNEVYLSALEQPPGERSSFVRDQCGGVTALIEEVERLLSAPSYVGDDFLGPIPGNLAAELPTGVKISNYDVLRELHRGGQGVVYQAIQRSTKRIVAIKVLLDGQHASRHARRRFEREVELVAQLKHPNIISIFDSGLTEDGHQFCVMDYVRGVPVTKYARSSRLVLQDVLALFAKICAAVSYAHQKGIIHRDLKPANILVSSDGEPRILDFGLAKLLGEPVETILSITGQVVGTLPYMAPEQARGETEAVDTRTDVYALGVILFELLTGQHPYPVDGPLTDVLHNIIDTVPIAPSRKWNSDIGPSGKHKRALHSSKCPIDDEVNTITLKALAKDPVRRYQSAAELSRDVLHYLQGEPIDAKRESRWYQLKSALRRYRVPVTFAASFVLLLAIAIVVITVLWTRAERARRIASTERDRLANTTAFLGDILSLPDPYRGVSETTLRQALSEATRLADDRFLNNPGHPPDWATRALVAQTLQSVATNLGDFTLARRELEIAMKNAVASSDPAQLSRMYIESARLAYYSGEGLDHSLSYVQDALAVLAKSQGGDGIGYLKSRCLLAENLFEIGLVAPAQEVYEGVFVDCQGGPCPSKLRNEILHDRAYILVALGDFESAEAWYRVVVEALEKTESTGLLLGKTYHNLGMALAFQGKTIRASEFIRRGQELRIARAGEKSKENADSVRGTGILDLIAGNNSIAIGHLNDAVAMQTEVWRAEQHQAIAFTRLALASALAENGADEERDSLIASAESGYRRMGVQEMYWIPWLYEYLRGRIRHFHGDQSGAADLLAKSVASFSGPTGLENCHSAMALGALAEVKADLGDLDGARVDFQRAIAVGRRELGRQHPLVASQLLGLSNVFSKLNNTAEALGAAEQAVAIRSQLNPAVPWLTARAEMDVARMLAASGKLEEARSKAAEAAKVIEAGLGTEDSRSVEAKQFVRELESAG